MNIELKLTGDGSHTLYLPALCEHYHSVHGAIQESRHVFINAGLKAFSQTYLNILEPGFGTGLNALLTFIEADAMNMEVKYTTYEPYPLRSEIWKQLNYSKILENSFAGNIYTMLHDAQWSKEILLAKSFYLHKIKEKIETAVLPENTFHLVYFDAFAPAVQPELWTYRVFRKLFEATKTGGILVTYSARGEVRRNLIKAGFRVERLQGAPGKREMLRATKT